MRGTRSRRSSDSASRSKRRSRTMLRVLKREPRSAASHEEISRQVRQSASKRGAGSRRAAALKAVQTKGHEKLVEAGKKAARTRKRRAA